MRLAVLKERRPAETRVAATPETVKNGPGALFQKFDDQGQFGPMVFAPGAPKAMFSTPGQFMFATPGRIL